MPKGPGRKRSGATKKSSASKAKPKAPRASKVVAKKAPAKKAPAKKAPAKKAPGKRAAQRVAASDGRPKLSGGPERVPRVPESRVRAAQLDWDDASTEQNADALVDRWVKRGEELLARLAEHGAARHEYRADLKDGRFVWLAPDGRVSAEAKAHVVCSWSRSTRALSMAWGDPLLRQSAVTRVDGFPQERDDVDEEAAWRVAMDVAEAKGAEYLYRVPTPHSWYFLALTELSFTPERASFSPGTPVGLVLKSLADTRAAIEGRAEPSDVIRDRLRGVGGALLQESNYAYRNTDWVARLQRTGNRLLSLAETLPRQSYGSIAAGRPTAEWIERDLAVEIVEAIGMLEDEWSAFA